MTELTIPILGMTCGGCVASVERALTSVDGVKAVVASLQAGQATVSFDPARVDAESLVQSITDAGYDVPADWNGAH